MSKRSRSISIAAFIFTSAIAVPILRWLSYRWEWTEQANEVAVLAWGACVFGAAMSVCGYFASNGPPD